MKKEELLKENEMLKKELKESKEIKVQIEENQEEIIMEGIKKLKMQTIIHNVLNTIFTSLLIICLLAMITNNIIDFKIYNKTKNLDDCVEIKDTIYCNMEK